MRFALHCFPPDGNIILFPEYGHIRSVRADLLCRQIVKCKNILDDAVLARVNRAFLRARIGHHHDLLFGDGILLFIRVNTEQPQHRIRRNIEQPYKRRKNRLHKADHRCHIECELFRIFHADALRHQFAEYKRQIGKQQRDKHDRDRTQHGFRNRNAGFENQRSQSVCEIIGGECSTDESGQRDRNLNRGKESCGLRRQLFQRHRLFVARSRHFIELRVVDRDRCDLRTGKYCIQTDQNQLQYKLPYHETNHPPFKDCSTIIAS